MYYGKPSLAENHYVIKIIKDRERSCNSLEFWYNIIKDWYLYRTN